MKVPKTFVPDKNVDEKTKEMIESGREGSVEITIEELIKDNMKILFGNTTEYLYSKILEYAAEKIVSDTFEGKINWKEDNQHYPNTLESYKAKVNLLNYEGKKITIPVLFQVVQDYYGWKWGYLHLGNERGPCKNSLNQKIKRLALEYFGVELN